MVLSFQNTCCWCSKEPSYQDGSFELPKHTFKLRAISEKNTWGGGGGGGEGRDDGRRYIFLWVFGAESFQVIWVIVVRPNLITWVVGVSLRGGGRKNIICQKREKFLSNLAKNG